MTTGTPPDAVLSRDYGLTARGVWHVLTASQSAACSPRTRRFLYVQTTRAFTADLCPKCSAL